jgi:RecA-family ATPase
MVTPKSGGLEGPDVTPPSWDTTAQDLTRHLAEGGDLDADTLERLADAAQEARKADHGSPVTLYRWRDIPKPPPRSWVVTDWIPAGCLSVIVGAGGYGKSTLAIQLAAAVASGAGGSDDWMLGAAIDGLPLGNAVPPDGAPAVYACWEDDAPEITRRLAAMSGEAAPWLNPDIDLHIAPLRGEGPLWEAQGRYELAGPTSLAHQLQAAVDQLDPAPALVILDSVAAIYSDDENDRRSVRAFLTWADRWATATGAAVLLVAHPPKNGADYSGSSDWLAGVRAMMKLSKEKRGTPPRGRAEDNRPDAWKLESVKVSYAAQPAAVQLERTPVHEGFSWQVAGPWDEPAEVATTPPPSSNGVGTTEEAQNAEQRYF